MESSRPVAYLHDSLTPHLLQGSERSLQSQERLAKVVQPLCTTLQQMAPVTAPYADRALHVCVVHQKTMHTIYVAESASPCAQPLLNLRECM